MTAVGGASVTVHPITADDVDSVSRYLHEHLNHRVPVRAWAGLLQPSWDGQGPNHGFQLISDGRIVGVYVAVYSFTAGRLPVCNLAAFCVLESHRAHSLRLVRALLAQKDFVFTDLSPSGSVPAMNDRLGFARLDTATRLVLNRPTLSLTADTVTDDPDMLEATLEGRDAEIYRDHRDAAASRHALVQRDDGYAYLMYRRDRRKRLPLFAMPLFVGGDPKILESSWQGMSAHLLRRGFLATLAERRVLGFSPPGPGRDLAAPRPRMCKGADPTDVDYLYSELVLLPW